MMKLLFSSTSHAASIVTAPMAKGEVSTALTAVLDPPYLRWCRACQATHLYEQPFRLAALRTIELRELLAAVTDAVLDVVGELDHADAEYFVGIDEVEVGLDRVAEDGDLRDEVGRRPPHLRVARMKRRAARESDAAVVDRALPGPGTAAPPCAPDRAR